MLSILTSKTESLYCACSPELGVFSFGGCRDEALNNLADQIRQSQVDDSSAWRQAPRNSAREFGVKLDVIINL